MACHENRAIACVNHVGERCQHGLSSISVKTVRWFISDDELWVVNDRTSQFRRLLHTRRER